MNQLALAIVVIELCCVDGHKYNSAVVVLISHDKISCQAKEDVCFNHPINTVILIMIIDNINCRNNHDIIIITIHDSLTCL